MGPPGTGFSIRLLTDATGYLAVGLIAATLLVGPFTLMRGKRTPISSYLRRDIGMWAAIASLIHVIVGFQVHGTGEILDYFVRVDGWPMTNSFGLGNWTGLAALVIVVLLLVISTDRTLGDLKAKTWKDLQRLNYTLFALVLLHAFFYGAILRISSPFTAILVITSIVVFAGQAIGIILWRRRNASKGRSPPLI